MCTGPCACRTSGCAAAMVWRSTLSIEPKPHHVHGALRLPHQRLRGRHGVAQHPVNSTNQAPPCARGPRWAQPHRGADLISLCRVSVLLQPCPSPCARGPASAAPAAARPPWCGAPQCAPAQTQRQQPGRRCRAHTGCRPLGVCVCGEQGSCEYRDGCRPGAKAATRAALPGVYRLRRHAAHTMCVCVGSRGVNRDGCRPGAEAATRAALPGAYRLPSHRRVCVRALPCSPHVWGAWEL